MTKAAVTPNSHAQTLVATPRPYRSAMSMLTFYINRAGKSLSDADRARLEAAKVELRKAFGRRPNSCVSPRGSACRGCEIFGGIITWSKSCVNIAAAKKATARRVSLPVFSTS